MWFKCLQLDWKMDFTINRIREFTSCKWFWSSWTPQSLCAWHPSLSQWNGPKILGSVKVNHKQELVSLQLRYRLDAFQKSSPPPQWAFASPHLRSGCTTWRASSFPPDSEQILHDLISYIQGLTWIMMNLIPIFVWPKASFWKVSSIKVHAFSPALLCYKTAESLSVQVGE